MMQCLCVECGGKTDCDSIICTECLAEIVNKVNSKYKAGKKQDEISPRKLAQPVRR